MIKPEHTGRASGLLPACSPFGPAARTPATWLLSGEPICPEPASTPHFFESTVTHSLPSWRNV